jgi:Fe-S-cluster-containing hydrogenase component 2
VCSEVCPADVDLLRAEIHDSNVSSYDCILCLKCVEMCPRDGCLSLEHAGTVVLESRFRERAASKSIIPFGDKRGRALPSTVTPHNASKMNKNEPV